MQHYPLTQTETSLMERLVLDENISYVHAVLTVGEAFTPHATDAPVYMTVIQGTLQLKSEEGTVNRFQAPTLVTIPKGTWIGISNGGDSPLELIVVKAPAPIPR